jgi:hypothetical protein
MNECLRELQSNFDKVELKKYRHDKAKRAAARTRAGKWDSVPKMTKEEAAGIMNEDLFNVERILHARANLPEPVPLSRQLAQTRELAEKLRSAAVTANNYQNINNSNNNNNNNIHSVISREGEEPKIGLIPFSRFARLIHHQGQKNGEQ